MKERDKFELNDKEILKMRKGKIGAKARITLLAFTFLFTLVTITLLIVMLDNKDSFFAMLFFYIFLGLSIVGIILLLTPTFFPKQWIVELNNKLYSETFSSLPKNTNFPIERTKFIDEQIYPIVVHRLSRDAIFEYPMMSVEIFEISKSTISEHIDGLDDDNYKFQGVIIIYKLEKLDIDRLEIQENNSNFVSSFKHYSTNTDLFDGLKINYENLNDKTIEFIKSDKTQVIIDFLRTNYSNRFCLCFDSNKLSIILSSEKANVHPIQYKSLKPMDLYKEKQVSLMPYALLTKLVLEVNQI